jgi:hypothetical protein
MGRKLLPLNLLRNIFKENCDGKNLKVILKFITTQFIF